MRGSPVSMQDSFFNANARYRYVVFIGQISTVQCKVIQQQWNGMNTTITKAAQECST